MEQSNKLRQFFTDNCINLTSFSEKHGLDRTTLSKVLNGKLKCKNKKKGADNSKTAKVAKVLWEIGAWGDEKPLMLQKLEEG